MVYIPRKFIRINDSDELIPIVHIYSELDTSGQPKYTLHLRFSAESITFDKILEIFNSNSKIHMYEEDDYFTDDIQLVHRITYENFCKNLIINKYDEEWTVLVDKKQDLDTLISDNKENNLAACAAIVDLYELKNNINQ